MTTGSVDDKLQNLQELLSGMAGAVLAYSGGVDSTFLLKVCRDFMGGRVLAVTAWGAIYPSQETEDARESARMLSVKHLTIETDQMEDPAFIANSPERCYHCKRMVFKRLKQIAASHHMAEVIDGSNTDDVADYRPGMKAARELGIRHPLMEAGLSREDIVTLSQSAGLPTWKKPPNSCLATRIPYGTPITKDLLVRIEQAEALLQSMGVRLCRVRVHGDTSRIEVAPADIPFLVEAACREEIVQRFRSLGFSFVTVDLAGYQSGSMNRGTMHGA